MVKPMRGAISSRHEADPFVRPSFPSDLDTPALVADADVVERNIGQMQRSMDEHGVLLRPHVKTHKSVALARLQLEAGAIGITVGTLGEAEVFAEAGISDLFLAYPLWVSPPKAERLRSLLERVDLLVGVDGVEAAEVLGRAMRGAERRLRISIEVDSGEARTGAPPDEAGVVAVAAERAGLDVAGVFTHGGHSYRSPGSAAAAADDEVRALERALASLMQAGVEAKSVSAGSTPTAHRSAREPVTEERPGSYVFGDRQQAALGGCVPADVGLWIAATVVSRSPDGHRVALDAGAKTLSRDRKSWMIGYGLLPAYPDAVVSELYDYHAVVDLPPDGSARPVVGEVVAIVPNHVCPVVNLFDAITVVRNGTTVGAWRVDAQSRSH
jgi:D-serine deaminase-like pyridoxal phosphate-dependent protein